MKKYTLKIFLNDTTLTETVTAETHTIENGVYIFWVRNDAGEWAQICTYPISCVAIARMQNAEGFAIAKPNNDNIKTNTTVDIEQLNSNQIVSIQEVGHIPALDTKPTKTKGKK